MKKIDWHLNTYLSTRDISCSLLNTPNYTLPTIASSRNLCLWKMLPLCPVDQLFQFALNKNAKYWVHLTHSLFVNSFNVFWQIISKLDCPAKKHKFVTHDAMTNARQRLMNAQANAVQIPNHHNKQGVIRDHSRPSNINYKNHISRLRHWI